MANTTFYQVFSQISPHLEMINRRLYYLLKPYADKYLNKKKKITKFEILTRKVDHKLIIDYVEKNGLKSGDICVVHSAYSELKPCNLSPQEWIDILLDYLGTKGTLAMPAIPIYPEPAFDNNGFINDIFTYEISSNIIWTGAIAKSMIKDPRSVRSKHPLNTMVAIGYRADEMMKDNDKDPYPCGPNSSWNYCYKHNAFILGLGTDLTHSLTMIHVAEDSFVEKWPIKDWYQDRTFRIKEGVIETLLKVKERKYHWGKLHFAERNLAKDLLSSKVMNSKVIDGILIENLRAKDLIDFLNKKNKKGYPYFWV